MVEVNADDGREPFGPPPPGIDATVAHPARIWNFWLGGRDWFKVDYAAGRSLAEEYPHLPSLARTQRAFLVRAVRYLAGPARIRQFLDLGSGLPGGGNTHEIAQRIAPDTGVVYVDNDPVVLAHAKAMLEAARDTDGSSGLGLSAPGVGGSGVGGPGADGPGVGGSGADGPGVGGSGAGGSGPTVMPAAVAAGLRGRPAKVTGTALRTGPVTYVDADLRDVGAVLRGAAATLSYARPVAVIMLGVLGYIADYDAARSVVRQMMDALPAGSYLAISDGVGTDDAVNRAHLRFGASADAEPYTLRQPTEPYTLRQPAELAGFFNGLELVPPGLVPCPEWKPDPGDTRRSAADPAPAHCAIARKP